MQLRLITKEDVQQCLSMGRAIELVEKGYVALSNGEVEVPLRTALANQAGTVLYKPAYSKEPEVFCTKVVSVFKGNVDKGLPVTPGVILVNNPDTGMPEAILEAGYLTALRTGAATGVATKLLAPAGAKVGALFGTGGQAFHQLEAMLVACAFEKIYVFSGNPENAVKFCEAHQQLAGDCQLIAQPEREVLKECDVVTTSTSFPTPVFEANELKSEVHINAIGSLGKGNTEIPGEVVTNSMFCVDQREACLAEAGEICVYQESGLLPQDFCPPEIGELLQESDYQRPSGVTLFKSVGNAVQDLLCSDEILKKAQELGRGQAVEL